MQRNKEFGLFTKPSNFTPCIKRQGFFFAQEFKTDGFWVDVFYKNNEGDLKKVAFVVNFIWWS